MPCLNQCCCCFSLRTGGFIMGWLGTIDAIIKGVGAIVFSVFLFSHKEQLGNISDEGRVVIVSSSLVSVGIALAVSIMLLVGSDKKNHLYLLPWLISNGLAAFGIFLTVLIIGGLFLCGGHGESEEAYNLTAIGTIIYSIGIPLSSLNIYFWICILSLYQSIRNEKASGHVYGMKPVPYTTLKV